MIYANVLQFSEIYRGATFDTETSLRLYHSHLAVAKVTQSKVVTATMLFGSLGGQASLWLGIRLATVIQLAFYAYYATCSRQRVAHCETILC